MNPALVVVIVLIVAALLIWACKQKKLDNYFNFLSGLNVQSSSPSMDTFSYYGYSQPPDMVSETIVASPPVPAAYPMYNINYRYPFGVPWDIDVGTRYGRYGRWRR
jgi:hypothetical protein